ncbi:Uncharacterized protein TCM_016104 [Theobroma cacao]|uniref:Uncharacterized protein n=1 Tax=Theobroma cacao TaxID=3641 RepID=A0A061G5P2_THECC|nr:Uncharacterized protein TCM_016104 [Theobroma cacao]
MYCEYVIFPESQNTNKSNMQPEWLHLSSVIHCNDYRWPSWVELKAKGNKEIWHLEKRRANPNKGESFERKGWFGNYEKKEMQTQREGKASA